MKETKNILLINGFYGEYRSAHDIPLGLLSIGTVLDESGYKVKIINASEFLDDCRKFLEQEWLFIGVSFMTPQVGVSLKVLGAIKKIRPDIKTVCGGIHPTLFPEQTIGNELIDIVVIGEGEYTALDLANCMSSASDLSKVQGIAYKSGGKMVRNADRPPSDINKEPFLNYGLLDISKIIDSDLSNWGGPKHIKALSIITGRGCPYQCTFCVNNAVLKKKFRFKDAGRILDEIESLVKKYNVECIRFQDEEFFVSKKRLLEFLDGLEKRNIRIRWVADVRANHFVDNYITIDLAKRIRSLGCLYWTLGVESASGRILEKIKKNITLEQVLRASEVSKESGINVGFGFMIGIPGEKKEDIVDTARFALKLKNRSTYELIFSIFRPYPGSELYSEAVELGMKEISTLEEWGRQDFYETKFQALDSYPWIKDRDFIKLIKFTTNNVFANYRRAYSWLLWTHVLRMIGIMRIKLNYWGFPVEYTLFNFAKKAINREDEKRWNLSKIAQ